MPIATRLGTARDLSPTYCTHGEPGARGGRTPPPIERAAWLRTTGVMERAGENTGKRVSEEHAGETHR